MIPIVAGRSYDGSTVASKNAPKKPLRKFGPRRAVPYLILAVALLVGYQQFQTKPVNVKKLNFTDFQSSVQAGEIKSAIIDDRAHQVRGELYEPTGAKYRATYVAEYADELTNELRDAKVPTEVKPAKSNLLLVLLLNFGPFILMIGVFVWMVSAMQGGGKLMQFGKAKARMVSKDAPKVTFSDVAGCDEAIEELREIRDFLDNPAKFAAIGAKIPKGVLLYGPPGTGKTLPAKAVAGEAGVPFLSISGSDFVEMFVGVGASRVRDLFDQAKQNAPAIIFVDEIDAVGRQRGAGMGGGHDEREQTLNQLLVEMDGFDARTGVILIAATNRPDILDPALLRPGRFDRQIVVDRPDLSGRQAIFRVHSAGKPLAADVDLDVLARRTPGFTGADIANLMNESALITARRAKQVIGMSEMESAIDRVIAGSERKSRVMSEEERRVIAYHEGGHALVGHVLPNADPIHKISITSRGRALGWTLALPDRDKYLVTRSALRDEMAMLLGGRSAEELLFSEPTTGAQNDIERVTNIARSMVTEFGMSDLLGPQQLGHKNAEVFLGRDFGSQANYSDEIAATIDHEIRALIESSHATALEILTAHRETLDRLVARLLVVETLETEEIAELFKDLPVWTKGPTAPAPKLPQAPHTPIAVPVVVEPAVRSRLAAARDLVGRQNRPARPRWRMRPTTGA